MKFSILVSSSILTILIASSISFATIRRVPTNYTTIQSAVNASQDADTVLLANGTYYEQVQINSRRLTLAGVYLFSHDTLDRDSTVITIPDSIRTGTTDQKSVLMIANSQKFYLIGITLREGLGTGGIHSNQYMIWGGCLIADSSNLVLEGCRIACGIANIGGGGTISHSQLLIMTDCAIDSNSGVEVQSGGLDVVTDTLYIVRCRFFRNSQTYMVGAGGFEVHQFGVIDSSYFIENSAPTGVGCIACMGSFYIHGNVFTGNRSRMNVGFIITTQTYGTHGEFVGNIVRDNIKYGNLPQQGVAVGGAILTRSDHNWLISNNIFDHNINEGYGDGALAVQMGNFTIHHNIFANNIGGVNAIGAIRSSAVYVMQPATVTIDSNIFSNNTRGSAILNTMGRLTIRKNDFYGNTAGALRYGGEGTWRADSNWWGDPSGPSATNNPGGRGDSVDYRVPYTPWLTRPVFPTGVTEPSQINPTPKLIELILITPNPFNLMTTIKYELPRRDDVELSLCDMMGRQVAVFFHGIQSAGFHSMTFDGSHYATGTYFVRLRAGNQMQVKKVVLLK